MPENYDADIDKTLAAIRSVSPPDGLNERIQQHLQYQAAHSATPAVSRPGKVWWAGLLTGAALATLVCCVVLFSLRNQAAPLPAITTEPTPTRSVPVSVSATEPRCPAPLLEPAIQRSPEVHPGPRLIRASEEPTPNKLTAQELKLVRLAETADPAQLSSMSFEAREQVDQQESAAFQSYFTPPPPPPHDLPGVNE